jgi:alpha-ribazole phosphatase
MEIHLVRHTRVETPKEVCYGATDVKVAQSFHEEAKNYKARLPNDFDLAISSPLTRCSKLAKCLFSGELKLDARLKEMNFGDWEGKSWSDIPPEELNPWMEDILNYSPPSGENLEQVYARCKSFYDDLQGKDLSKILIVAHAGIIRCTWAYLLGFPVKDMFKIPVGFGEILVFNLSLDKSKCYITQKK